MHPSKRQLGSALAPLLKEHSFRKRAMTWHRPLPGMIHVFHVEKDRWGGDSYQFHLAIYLTACGSDLTPPYYRCPIQVRLDTLVQDRKKFLRLSNFEDSSVSLSQRLDLLVAAVREFGIPWLDAHSTMPALQRLVDRDYEKLLAEVLVLGSAFNYLRGLPKEQ